MLLCGRCVVLGLVFVVFVVDNGGVAGGVGPGWEGHFVSFCRLDRSSLECNRVRAPAIGSVTTILP